MQITITAVETNPRGNGIATLNGLGVTILDAGLTGTDAQIRWATEIMTSALRLLAQDQVAKAGRSGLYKADELDAAIARVNQMLAPVAARLTGTSAAKWVDNRDLHHTHLIRAMGTI